MISEADKLSRIFTVRDAEKRSDVAHIGGPDALANKHGFAQNAFLSAAGIRPGGADIAQDKRGLRMNRVAAKTLAAKGGRPAAHGHSRHK